MVVRAVEEEFFLKNNFQLEISARSFPSTQQSLTAIFKIY